MQRARRRVRRDTFKARKELIHSEAAKAERLPPTPQAGHGGPAATICNNDTSVWLTLRQGTAHPPVQPVFPLLKTVEQMSKISGIGENKLRELMDNGEIAYVQNGNRRLLAEAAIWDWYERHKIAVRAACPVEA